MVLTVTRDEIIYLDCSLEDFTEDSSAQRDQSHNSNKVQ